jgi:hypothetical protein
VVFIGLFCITSLEVILIVDIFLYLVILSGYLSLIEKSKIFNLNDMMD